MLSTTVSTALLPVAAGFAGLAALLTWALSRPTRESVSEPGAVIAAAK